MTSHSHTRFLRILDRMIATDVLKTLASVLLIIVLIVVSNKFLKILNKAIEGEVSGDTILIVLGLKIIAVGIDAFPAALFAAILMVIGRMYRDNEMTSLAVGQGGLKIIYRALMVAVIPLTVLIAVLSLQVLPWAEKHTQTMLKEAAKSAEIQGISAGRFNEYSHGDLVFYIEEITDDREMRNIFVQNRQHGEPSIIISDSARMEINQQGDKFITLTNGRRYKGEPGTATFTISEFKKYGLRIQQQQDTPIVTDIEAKKTSELWSSSNLQEIAELQKRISIPIGALILTFLAVPLSNSAPRSGVYGNLLIAFLFFLVYNNLLTVAQSWLIKGTTPTWLGFTWVYGLMIVIGFGLIIKSQGFRWFMRNLPGATNT